MLESIKKNVLLIKIKVISDSIVTLSLINNLTMY